MGCDRQAKSRTVVHTVTPGKRSAIDEDLIAGDLQKTLLAAVSNAADKPIAVEQILVAVRAELPAVDVVHLARNDAGNLSLAGVGEILERLPPDADEKLQHWAAESCQSGTATTHPLTGAHRWTTVFVPVMFRNQPPEILVAVFRKGAAGSAHVAGSLALAASHLTLWSILQETKHLQQETRNASALLELLTALDDCRDLSAACLQMVTALRDYLACTRIILGLCRRGKMDCRVAAISGLSDFDKRSDYIHQVQAVLNEAVVRHTATRLSADDLSPAEGTLAHQDLISSTRCEQLISTPLFDNCGQVVGAWLFIEDRSGPADDQTLNFAQAGQHAVGSRLQMLRYNRANPLRRLARACFGNIGARRATLVLLGLVFLVAVMLVPVNYKISCECQLEPVLRRYIAAPYDGTLQESLVEAGQLVQQGQVLARMDARELRWQLSGLEADYQSERKKRDAAAARDEVALSQQSDLEMQRIDLQIQLIQHRLENLDVKSPIDGVVISGDLKKSEGVPLAIGETMFEIGPLDEMIVEVAIPEREILYSQPGMPVEIRLDAVQHKTIAGNITRISPRSEIRDRASVYIAEVRLDNRQEVFRPGMKGTAKVVSDPHPLGWNLFHKAWESLALLIGC